MTHEQHPKSAKNKRTEEIVIQQNINSKE